MSAALFGVVPDKRTLHRSDRPVTKVVLTISVRSFTLQLCIPSCGWFTMHSLVAQETLKNQIRLLWKHKEEPSHKIEEASEGSSDTNADAQNKWIFCDLNVVTSG